MWANFKQWTVTHMLLAIGFFVCGILINFGQILLYYTIRPFNKKWYRKINYYCCYCIFTGNAFLAEWWSNTKLIIYVNKSDIQYFGKEHTLGLVNHTYEIDWLILHVFCNHYNFMGNIRTYAKSILAFFPVLGWSFAFSENIHLSRKNAIKDCETIEKTLKNLQEYPHPVPILYTPEGTRFTQEKLIKANEYARSKGYPEMKHHLTAKPKGYLTTLGVIKESFGSVLDITLVFDPNAKFEPTLVGLLNGNPLEAHVFIKRFPMRELSVDPVEGAAFLRNLYVEKDKLVDNFFETGQFLDKYPENIERIELTRHTKTLVVFLLMCVVSYTIFGIWLIRVFLSGSIWSIGFTIAILILVYFVMNVGLKLSQVKKIKTV